MPTRRRIEATLKEMEEMLATLRAINEEQNEEWETEWNENQNRYSNISMETDPDDIW